MVYSNILKELDNDLSIDETVLYLLYRICQESFYDVRIDYLADDIDLQEKIYFGFKDIDRDEDNRLVCHTGAMLLHDLLKRINIHSEIVYSGDIVLNPEHFQLPGSELIYQDEKGNYKYVNIVINLLNCKLGLMPRNFGIGSESLKIYRIDKPIAKLSSEELKEMCNKLKIYEPLSWDTFMMMLRKEIKNNNDFKDFLKETDPSDNIYRDLNNYDLLEKKLDFISKYLRCKMKNVGPSEIQQFYMYLLWGNTFNKNEIKHGAKMMNYYRRLGDEVDVVNVIQIADDKGRHKYYVYDTELGTYEKIENVEQFFNRVQGYALYDNREYLTR